jgi:hypothetical protein
MPTVGSFRIFRGDYKVNINAEPRRPAVRVWVAATYLAGAPCGHLLGAFHALQEFDVCGADGARAAVFMVNHAVVVVV